MEAPATVRVLLACQIDPQARAPGSLVQVADDGAGDHHLRRDHGAPHHFPFPGAVAVLTRSEIGKRALGGRFLEPITLEMRTQNRHSDRFLPSWVDCIRAGFDTLTRFTCFYCLSRSSQTTRFQGLSRMRSQPTGAATCLMCQCRRTTRGLHFPPDGQNAI